MNWRAWINSWLQPTSTLVAGITLFASLTAGAQQAKTPRPLGSSVAKKEASTSTAAWRVKVSKTAPVTVTVSAQDTPLTDVIAEIGRQLGVPVLLSQVMKIQRLTLNIKALPLETFMKTIAPQAYVDYVLRGSSQQQPKYVALYFYAYNETPPAMDAVVKGKSQALLVQGTFGEEDNQAQEVKPDEPLQVTLNDKLLSVRAVKQPLALVLAEIADKYGIPFEMEFETNELVDMNFSKYTFEQAGSKLPSNVRLYFRTDLQTYQNRPLRLVLGAPVKP